MRILLLLVLFLAISFSKLSAQDLNAIPGKIMLMLKPNTDIQQSLDQIEGQAGMSISLKVERQLSKRLNIWLLDFDPLLFDGELMLESLRENPNTVLAQFDHYVEVRSTFPDDIFFDSQWNMHNDGTNGSKDDADIDAPEAWDISTGGLTAMGDTIVVAVIDGGADLNHSDLNYWKNHNDPINGTDDDGNGYRDDFNGWNAYNNNGNVDTDDHGTHVSGIVGAIGDNFIGVTGVNWDVRIMPISGSSSNESTVVAAYSYALELRATYNETYNDSVRKGAFVVATNSSFGLNFGQPSNAPIWCAMYDSLGVYGILSAGAAPNLSVNVDVVGDLPTACESDHLITVTNMQSDDSRNGGAGFGKETIDIGAPGTNIYSANQGGGYVTMGGTSMATPHVAGAVALMYAAACPRLIQDHHANPALVAKTIKDYIMSGVDSLPNLNNIVVSEGRLNMHKSLLELDKYNCSSVGVKSIKQRALQLRRVYPNPSLGWTAITYSLPVAAEISIKLRNVMGQEVFWINQQRHAGIHSHKLDFSNIPSGVYQLSIESKTQRSNSMTITLF